MANRKRKFVLRVPVTPEERALIQEKMAQLGTKNFSAYARKMLIPRDVGAGVRPADWAFSERGQ